MLRLPVLAEADFVVLPEDDAVQRRLQDVEFAQSSQALGQVVQQGDMQAARAMLAELEKRFAQHPWLRGKLTILQERAEKDPEMMSKEIRFNAMRMSSRRVQKSEAMFSQDETECVMPAFLRKKLEEGKDRKGKGDTA